MHRGLVFTTGKWAQTILWRLFCGTYSQRKGRSVWQKYMKKYNEDKVNYANSKRRVFKVGIMWRNWGLQYWGKTIKSVQRQYYLLSCRFLLFTEEKRKMKPEVFFCLQDWGDRLSNQCANSHRDLPQCSNFEVACYHCYPRPTYKVFFVNPKIWDGNRVVGTLQGALHHISYRNWCIWAIHTWLTLTLNGMGSGIHS